MSATMFYFRNITTFGLINFVCAVQPFNVGDFVTVGMLRYDYYVKLIIILCNPHVILIII